MQVDWSKVEQPDIVFQRFASRRSVVYGAKGIVAASQPLAVEAGLEILRKGGNAGECSCYNVCFRFAHRLVQLMPLWRLPRLSMSLSLAAVELEGLLESAIRHSRR